MAHSADIADINPPRDYRDDREVQSAHVNEYSEYAPAVIQREAVRDPDEEERNEDAVVPWSPRIDYRCPQLT